jgi:hypothetical protein
MAGERFADGSTDGRIPQLHSPIVATGRPLWVLPPGLVLIGVSALILVL